jgi:hypothetical protein
MMKLVSARPAATNHEYPPFGQNCHSEAHEIGRAPSKVF